MFSSGGPSVRFLTRYDGEVSEPLVGRQGSRVQGWPYTRLAGTLQAESAEKSRYPLGQNEENKAPPPKTRPGQAQMPSWERA